MEIKVLIAFIVAVLATGLLHFEASKLSKDNFVFEEIYKKYVTTFSTTLFAVSVFVLTYFAL